MRRFPTLRLVSIVLAAGVVGCGDMRPTGPGGASSGGGIVVVTPKANPIVGKWSFTRYFVDDAGYAHLSQTVWEFSSSGFVTRTLYSDNISAGVGDVITSTGTWSTSGGKLLVTLQGSPSPVSYDYHFEGDRLIIAGTAFIRLVN